jgi:hypothetical protein
MVMLFYRPRAFIILCEISRVCDVTMLVQNRYDRDRTIFDLVIEGIGELVEQGSSV